jgi:hypothetical protein
MQNAIVMNKDQIKEFFALAQVNLPEIHHLYVSVDHEDGTAKFSIHFDQPKYYISKTAMEIRDTNKFKEYLDYTMGAEWQMHNIVYPEPMESEKEDSYEFVLEFMKKHNLLYKKIQKWESGDSYIGDDLSDYYVILSRHRDSGILDTSNWDSALKKFDEKDILIVHFSHWAVGWVDQLLIKEDNYLALENADEMMDNAEPFIDEDDYYQRVSERAGALEGEIKNDLRSKFQGNEFTYPEKVKYVDHMWNLDLTQHDKIYNKAEELAGEEM